MGTFITALGPNDPDDGQQGRRERGLAIANFSESFIRPDEFGYKVNVPKRQRRLSGEL